jgi:multidrug efflux pump subunit AcrB
VRAVDHVELLRGDDGRRRRNAFRRAVTAGVHDREHVFFLAIRDVDRGVRGDGNEHIIPLLAVPVSLIGTLAVMHALGFSVNALSLFGLVLAIGIVVDDAIVVVENVERNIGLGYPPLEATRRAMREVTGPIVATALVLCAVFIPTAFISGLTGQFYKQFAITIAISTVISAFNSLTLSPALCALLLKPHGAKKDWFSRLIDFCFGWFFRQTILCESPYYFHRWSISVLLHIGMMAYLYNEVNNTVALFSLFST